MVPSSLLCRGPQQPCHSRLQQPLWVLWTPTTHITEDLVAELSGLLYKGTPVAFAIEETDDQQSYCRLPADFTTEDPMGVLGFLICWFGLFVSLLHSQIPAA